MWIIEAVSKRGEIVYKVDRQKFPYMSWSNNIAHALQFYKEDAAIKFCSYYKFGNPKVKELNGRDNIVIAINEMFAKDFKR